MHETPGAPSPASKTGKIVEDLRTITPDALRARMWSITDTGVILGRLSRRQVNRLIKDEQLDTRYIGSRRVVVGASLAEFMENLPTEPQTETQEAA